MAALAAGYEGFEQPDSFDSDEALAVYRATLLERTAAQADFLAARGPESGEALEVGTGNGRLLIQLARSGAIEGGLGIDLAHSRVDFACAWAADEGLDALSFEAGDALELDLGHERFSIAVCITGAFAYLDPIAEGSGTTLLGRLAESLRPGGLLCLELYPHPRQRRLLEAGGGEVRVWSELPDDDPWRYYLSDLALDGDGRIVTHTKTFIHRTTGEIDEGRVERLRLYAPEEIAQMIESAGLGDIELCGGWDGRPYAAGDELLIVTGRR